MGMATRCIRIRTSTSDQIDRVLKKYRGLKILDVVEAAMNTLNRLSETDKREVLFMREPSAKVR